MKVAHLIIGLGKGGAETMLYNVLKYRSNKTDYQPIVVSMGEGSYYAKPIRELGISLAELNLRKHPLHMLIEIRRMMKDVDVLCCWMEHASLIGYITCHKLVRKIIWNIRHSNIDPKYENITSYYITKICSLLSNRIDIITYNGSISRRNYQSLGFSGKKNLVLDNGCDLSAYEPKANARLSICDEYCIPINAKIVLSVARYHPYKDLPTFLSAFVRILQVIPEAVAIMCGSDITYDNNDLCQLIVQKGLKVGKNVILTGLRDDLPRFFSASDIYILHSASEAFPNTLIQAMSCGCLIVATDVGTVSEIIKDRSVIVQVGNDIQMADCAIRELRLPEDQKMEKSKANRNMVKNNYDIHEVVKKYEGMLYEQ